MYQINKETICISIRAIYRLNMMKEKKFAANVCHNTWPRVCRKFARTFKLFAANICRQKLNLHTKSDICQKFPANLRQISQNGHILIRGPPVSYAPLTYCVLSQSCDRKSSYSFQPNDLKLCGKLGHEVKVCVSLWCSGHMTRTIVIHLKIKGVLHTVTF